MINIDLERLLNEPIYAFDFQYMIGDVEVFLDFSESNIEWQYRRELRDIDRALNASDYPREYGEHLKDNAAHRFNVSLALRVRYAALVALTTSVEWSIQFLVERLKNPIGPKPKRCNETVHALRELQQRTGAGTADTVHDYERLVFLRNCIAHHAGIVEHDNYGDQLPDTVKGLAGFTLDDWHLFGRHVCIEKGALNPYIRQIGELIVALHKTAHEQGLVRNDTLRPLGE